jgi:hypothetical protein
VTNHRVYREPTRPEAAVDIFQVVLEARPAVALLPGPRHWTIFGELCRSVGARANVVPDASLAALAIEHQATWVTVDQGFAHFPCIRVTLALTPGLNLAAAPNRSHRPAAAIQAEVPSPLRVHYLAGTDRRIQNRNCQPSLPTLGPSLSRR